MYYVVYIIVLLFQFKITVLNIELNWIDVYFQNTTKPWSCGEEKLIAMPFNTVLMSTYFNILMSLFWFNIL